MNAYQSGVSIGTMFDKQENKASPKSAQDYDKELKALKLEEQKIMAELVQLEKEMPEKRKAFNELLKKRAIIDEALEKVERQLIVERFKAQSKEDEA